MKAFILAAGLGKRLRPYTDHVPKPLVLVHGRPLILYTLDNIVRAQVHHIGFNAHYLGEQMRSYMASWQQQHPSTTLYFSNEHHLLLGTGGALVRALSILDYPDAFIVFNSDTFWYRGKIIEKMCATFDKTKMDVLVGCVTPRQIKGYKGQGDFGGRVFTGVQIISRSLLLRSSLNQPFNVHHLWAHAQQIGRFQTVDLDGNFMHVGDTHFLKTLL